MILSAFIVKDASWPWDQYCFTDAFY